MAKLSKWSQKHSASGNWRESTVKIEIWMDPHEKKIHRVRVLLSISFADQFQKQ